MNERTRQRTISETVRVPTMALGAAFLCSANLSSPVVDLDLSWNGLDGGGAMRSSGGEFELSGTIGQPDAGEPMTGGGFQLTGGFWFETPPGDCDFDGQTNLPEYAAFEQCLMGPLDARPPACACYDVNRDGLIDLKDYFIFQGAFSASP